MVCRPTYLGGLGVLDLRFFGFALRLRWEWLSRTARGSCWSSLPSRPEKSVAAMAAVSITVNIGNGASARLWTDSWASVGPLCHYAPNLYAAISRARKKRTIKDGIFQHRWARDIVGALTTQVLVQYLRVWSLLREVILDPLQEDRFVWRWTADGKYSASSAYRASPDQLRCWELRSCGRLKRQRMSSSFSGLCCTPGFGHWSVAKGMACRNQDDDACVLCGQESETVDHLFIGCVLTREL